MTGEPAGSAAARAPAGPGGASAPAGPGGAIRADNPFVEPVGRRRPLRRFRGRLPAPVTLWTAADGPRRAGLPVSSVLVADGEPGQLLGLVDADAELWPVLSAARRFVVQVLRWPHRRLADAFAEIGPAPGGVFAAAAWTATEWGPVLDGGGSWSGCRLVEARELGWSLLVQGEVEHVEIRDDADALVHRQGRYHTLPQ